MADNRNQETSQFNARADNAALSLRQKLQSDGAQIPDSQAVEVGPDGQPPQPLPPPGSYARDAIERQQAAQQARQQLGDQPPAGTTEGMIDGSQAPPLTAPGQPPQETPAPEQPSPNAQQRIKTLIDELRAKDQELQNFKAEQDGSNAELKAKLDSLQTQHDQLIQANLENLDPETRMQVMQDARLQEVLAGFKNEIMGQIMPHLQGLEQKSAYSEMMSLGDTYPAFDVQIHGPLIEMFRGKNPHCSILQAFRAVAEPEELVTRETASAQAVPPIVPAGNGVPTPRYMPDPSSQTDPEQELIEESQMFKKLMASQDPDDHRMGQRLVEHHLSRRLGRSLPQ